MLKQKRKDSADNRVNGLIVKATILNVNIIQGRIHCDVIDVNGNFYTNCEVISQGSGGQKGYNNVSIEKNQEVVIILTGRNSSPYVLGTTYRSSLANIQLQSEERSRNDDIYTITINDDYRKVGLNSTSVTEKNGIIINSAQDIRMQLMLGGKLRISACGQTNDNPLNGQAFIDNLFTYIQNLENRLLASETVLKVALTFLKAADPTTFNVVSETYNAVLEANPVSATTTKTDCETTINTKIELPK